MAVHDHAPRYSPWVSSLEGSVRSRWFSGRRTWLLLCPAVIAALLSASSPSAAGVSPAAAADVDPALRGLVGDVAIIVQERAGFEGPAAAVVEGAGGSVDTELPLIHGFA